MRTRGPAEIRRLLYRLPCNCIVAEFKALGMPTPEHADGCNYWIVKGILEIIGESSPRATLCR